MIERAREFKGGVLLKVAEHTVLGPEVEALRGVTLLIPAEEAPPLEDGEVFVHELVGMRVVSGGETVGTVADVYDGAAGHLLGIRRPGRPESIIPYVAALVRSVDRETRVIELEEVPGLLDV